MRALFTAVVLGLLGGTGALRGAAPESFAGVDGKWHRYESPHFELYSHNGQALSRQLLHNLEFLRTVFLDTLSLKEIRPLGVTIYYFGSESEFQAYLSPLLRLNKNVAGYYFSRADRAMIVLPPPREPSEALRSMSHLAAPKDEQQMQRSILHEYIHHLTYITGDTPALWYGEGVAELFSTIKEERDGFVLGLPVENHVEYLRWTQFNGWMPLDELFATDHTSANYHEALRAGFFYAESWALLHFWLFGHSEFSADQLATFIDYSRQDGGNPNAAERRRIFQAATGLDYKAMEEKLRSYVNNGKYGWRKLPLPKMAGKASYAMGAVSRDEIQEQLTELDYRINHGLKSKLALVAAADRDPGNPRRNEVLGAEALLVGDEAEARERWLKALDAGTNNSAVFHSLAVLENKHWLGEFDPIYFRLPEETGDYLRKLLSRSIQSAPDQVEAYQMLAWVEAMSDQPHLDNVNLVQHHYATLQQRTRTALALALVRVRVHDEAGAREILDQLEQTKPGEEHERTICVIRKYLDEQHRANP